MQKAIKIIFVLAFILSAHIVRAQKLVYMGIEHLSKGVKEAFYVLRDDPHIKHGEYKLLRMKNYVPIYKGYYKNNLKDSLWREFDIKENLVAEGYYKAGVKTGVWKYYSNKVLSDEYDFGKNTLVYHLVTNADTVQTYKIIQGKDTLYSRVNRAPILLGGLPALTNTFIDIFKEPRSTVFAEVEGSVIAGFTIDETGSLSDFRVLRALKNVDNNDILTLVKKTGMVWLPAMVNDKPVKTMAKIPIRLY